MKKIFTYAGIIILCAAISMFLLYVPLAVFSKSLDFLNWNLDEGIAIVALTLFFVNTLLFPVVS